MHGYSSCVILPIPSPLAVLRIFDLSYYPYLGWLFRPAHYHVYYQPNQSPIQEEINSEPRISGYVNPMV